MNYIAFSLASAAKDGGKTVVIPSEEIVSNDKDIVAKILKAVREKKADAGITLVEIAPELKDYLDGLKGGDGK